MRRLLIPLLAVVSCSAWAGSARSSKHAGLNLGLGVPELIALQIRGYGMDHFSFGGSFGSAPIGRLIAGKLPLNEISLGSFNGKN